MLLYTPCERDILISQIDLKFEIYQTTVNTDAIDILGHMQKTRWPPSNF